MHVTNACNTAKKFSLFLTRFAQCKNLCKGMSLD